MSVVYLDSYHEVRRIKAASRDVLEGTASDRHRRFIKACEDLRLPLNQGKKLVGAVRGGDLDGETGTFEASHDKKVNLMGLAAALMGYGRATEFELRHFAGKAIFAMAFRHPTMSLLEEIFVDIGKAKSGQVELNRKTVDEIYAVMALLPLMYMNLRARFDREVTITDASPTGGGGATATEFKDEPDCTRHPAGNECAECERELEEGRTYPCPAGCGVKLCSLHCTTSLREGTCRRKLYTVPKFGERFAGPNAPLSRAVARVGGIVGTVRFATEEEAEYAVV